MTFDVKLFYFLNDLAGQSRIFDTAIVFFAEYFQYFLVLTLLLLLYFSGYAKQEKLRIFWVIAASTIVARLGMTELIRFFYHRPRPFMTYQVHQLLTENAWSFPSGHSAFFFAMATTLCFYNKKWGIGFFVAALLMNISRVIAGVHYPTDILGGMLIGIVVGWCVFYFAERMKLPVRTAPSASLL
ncbi:MAG: phosphatase PAP2 family protein [bacterium]|nr:phosphatase PAP2 family protein [bacterium]